jgi:4a-hydroxytetrahydrobiopterin dehydratase
MTNLLPLDFDFHQAIPLWKINSEAQVISREFTFTDFTQAFEFMSLCAQYANELDHHPDWSNSWNKVSVNLSTHSAKQITQLDIQMAKQMDIYALQISAHRPHDPLR